MTRHAGTPGSDARRAPEPGPSGRRRLALVTGAGDGLGAAIARGLCAMGLDVAICGRRAQPLRDLAASLASSGAGVLPVAADVARESDVRTLFAATSDWRGDVDVLVNNAAINPSRGRGVLDADLDEWERILAVNLRGPLLCARHAVPGMRRRGQGRIVNIGSIASRRIPDGRNPAYRASKFALRALNASLAHELRSDRIGVSLVMPGSMATPMLADAPGGGADRLAPEAVARVVCFLVATDPDVVIPEVTVSPRAEIAGGFSPYP